jgi:hypothetical protein
MGQPIPIIRGIRLRRRRTRGTETSNYPEEEKTIVISLVVANEREKAQTDIVLAISGL